jgi:hypothetical protein
LAADQILAYLRQEATGMKVNPQQIETVALENGDSLVTVKGRVKALVFAVNVGWSFTLNNRGEILEVTVKLLASLQELMQIQR